MGRGLDGSLGDPASTAPLCGFQGPRRAPVSPAFGGGSERDTPLPIPNRAVKPLSADGTWPSRAWESRSPPVWIRQAPARSAPPGPAVGAGIRPGELRWPRLPATVLSAHPLRGSGERHGCGLGATSPGRRVGLQEAGRRCGCSAPPGSASGAVSRRRAERSSARDQRAAVVGGRLGDMLGPGWRTAPTEGPADGLDGAFMGAVLGRMQGFPVARSCNGPCTASRRHLAYRPDLPRRARPSRPRPRGIPPARDATPRARGPRSRRRRGLRSRRRCRRRRGAGPGGRPPPRTRAA
jgi:hypothetical protein